MLRLSALLAVSAALLVPDGAAAAPPPDVGFAGLASPDLGAAELAEIESAVEQMLGRQARVRGKSGVLAALSESEAVAANLAAARRSAETGSQALDVFDLPKALEDLGRALALYGSAFGARLVPGEVARVYERRAQAAYALRRSAEMRSDFARAVLLQPAKGLDERVFAPDAIAAFADEASRVRAGDAAPPAVQELVEIARRTGVRWVFAGDARMREGLVRLQLTVVSSSGTVSTRDFRGPRESIGTGLERGLTAMLDAAGVPKRKTIAFATPTPTPAQVDGPRNDKERSRTLAPLYKRWYVWAVGALLAGAAAAYATSDRPEGNGGGGGTVDPGITIVFEDP